MSYPEFRDIMTLPRTKYNDPFKKWFRKSFENWRTGAALNFENYQDGEEGEDFYESVNIDQMNLFERRGVDNIDYRMPDEADDDEFDNLAYCRTDSIWKTGIVPKYPSLTDSGICLYECFWRIKNYDLASRICKHSKNEIIEAIHDSFWSESDSLINAVIKGNPLAFYKEVRQLGYNNISIYFYEDPELKLMESPEMDSAELGMTQKWVIIIRAAHASLHTYEAYLEGKHRIITAFELYMPEGTESLNESSQVASEIFILTKLAGINESKKKAEFKKKARKEKKALEEEKTVEEKDKEVLGDVLPCNTGSKLLSKIASKNRVENLASDFDYSKVFNLLPKDVAMYGRIDNLMSTLDAMKLISTAKYVNQRNAYLNSLGEVVEETIEERVVRYANEIGNSPFSSEDLKIESELLKSMSVDHNLINRMTKSPAGEIELAFDFETVLIDGIFFIYAWCAVNIYDFKQRIYHYGIEDGKSSFITLVECFLDKDMECDVDRVRHRAKTTTTVRFWSFNGFRFDCIFFLPYFLKYRSCEMMGDIRNIKKLTINKNVHFHDLRLLLPGGRLSDIGKSFAPKEFQKEAFDHNRVKIESYMELKNEVLYYCFFDCFCLAACTLKLFVLCDEFDVTHHAMSGADLTMRIYRTGFYRPDSNNNWYITGLTPDIHRLVKSSYFGGECVAFARQMIDGDTEGEAIDIVSSYPTILEGYCIPYKFMTQSMEVFQISDETFNAGEPDYVFDTTLFLIMGFQFKKDILYPFIPEKDVEGNLWFPLMSNSPTWVWGHTIRFGIANDCFAEPINVISRLFFYADKIFSKFINTFFNKRLDIKKRIAEHLKNGEIDAANDLEAYSDFYKRQMNSLYGKFGQRQFDRKLFLNHEQMKYMCFVNGKAQLYHRAKPVTNDKDVNFDKKISDFSRNLDMVEFFDEDPDLFSVSLLATSKSRGIGSCIHIASYVTSMARVRLNEGIYKLTEKGRKLNVYYCDTDSIYTRKFTDTFGLPKEMLGDKLGQWKLEGSFTDAIFIAPKMYMFKRKSDGKHCMKCKGIFKEKLKPEFFHQINDSGETSINVGGMFKRILSGVKVVETVKILTEHPRRQWLESGESLPALRTGGAHWILAADDTRLRKKREKAPEEFLIPGVVIDHTVPRQKSDQLPEHIDDEDIIPGEEEVDDFFDDE
jgi:hypothetical protein